MSRRCPTCGHWWLRRPRWYQFWLWPAYWTRCPFLDFFDQPVTMNEAEFVKRLQSSTFRNR